MNESDKYPPNPTNMPDDVFKSGVDVLTTLVDIEEGGSELSHIESILNEPGVDAALYLLYHGYCIKRTIYGEVYNEAIRQKEFRTLLQTAASIGAYMSRHKQIDFEKFDKMWNVPYTEGDDNVQSL